MLLVCPNPTMDRQVFLDELHPGAVIRARKNRVFPGGKPVDVWRAMKAHEMDADLLVLVPEHDQGYASLLDEEGVRSEIFSVPGTLRDTMVLYEDAGRTTVINGPGVTLERDMWDRFVATVLERAEGQDWVAVTGSFPLGVTGDDVASLVTQLKTTGARVALDTGPTWLPAGIEAGPDLVTPNLAEAMQSLSGVPAVESVEVAETAERDSLEAARQLAAHGIEFAVVTVGSAGTAWARGEASGFVPAVKVDVVNPIGAGDAFIGGLLARLACGDEFGEAVAWGCATAASAVAQWVPGKADAAQTVALRKRIG